MSILDAKKAKKFPPPAEHCEKIFTGEKICVILSLLVTAIVLFCSSGTGIYGCLDAGMTGNVTVLLSKSIMDFFTAMVLVMPLSALWTNYIAPLL